MNNQRTIVGFVIFVICLVIGLVLIDREEITESDNKD